MIVIGSILALCLIATIVSLRAKTWQRFSLKQNIDSTSQPLPEQSVQIGDKGITMTRLNPLGKVVVAGETYEARSVGDLYVDPKKAIEVIGFENFTLIVKIAED